MYQLYARIAGFQDLVDPVDGHFGVRVATGFNANANFSNFTALGSNRIGSDLALAVDTRGDENGREWRDAGGAGGNDISRVPTGAGSPLSNVAGTARTVGSPPSSSCMQQASRRK